MRESQLRSYGNTVSIGMVVRDLGFILLVAGASVWIAWIGYQGWGLDDAHYLLAAERWASAPPYVGETHWELRLGFVVPLAAAVALLGYNEAALIAAPALFYAALLLVNYGFVSALVGRSHALFAAVLTATVPLIAAWATTPRVAIAEAFYLSLAFWCFVTVALTHARAPALLLGAGVCFGLAWLSRESAIGFALAFIVLFAFGRPVPRRHYIWLALGAAVVVVAELGFYAVNTGNPFYRPYIDLHHGVITSTGGQGEEAKVIVARAKGEMPSADVPAEARQRIIGEAGSGVREDVTEPAGNEETQASPGAELGLWGKLERFGRALHAHFDPAKLAGQGSVAPVPVSRMLEPYVLFLIEPYYGLVFWLAVPALIYLFAVRAPPRSKALAALLVLFAAASVIGSLYLMYLRPLPRYFLFAAVAAAVVTGLTLGTLWEQGRRRVTLVVLCGFLLTSAVFMEARRGLGLYNERRLVNFATSTQTPIFTDAITIQMSDFFIRNGRFRGAVAGCPLPGAVYFFNSMRSADEETLMALSLGELLGTTKLVFQHRGREKILGKILHVTGLAQKLPEETVHRLGFPYGIAGVFDVGWVELCARVAEARPQQSAEERDR